MPLVYPRFPIVSNTGATARDALANERTFLAWLRTAVTAISTGAVLAGLDTSRLSTVASAMFIAQGALILIYAAPRYYHTLWLLRSSRFAPDVFGPALLSLLTLATGGAALAFVLR